MTPPTDQEVEAVARLRRTIRGQVADARMWATGTRAETDAVIDRATDRILAAIAAMSRTQEPEAALLAERDRLADELATAIERQGELALEADGAQVARQNATARAEAAESLSASLGERVAELEAAATKAAERFRFYETQHVEAGKLIKAATNASMAEMLERALQPRGGE